jgi:hypothetical protein
MIGKGNAASGNHDHDNSQCAEDILSKLLKGSPILRQNVKDGIPQ